jgi:membrane protease YdiL (CAAX protease family)
MPYQAYTSMLASAQKYPQSWRVFVGLVAALLSAAILTPLFLTLVGAVAPELNAIGVNDTGEIILGSTPGGLFAVLASFALLLGTTLFVAKQLHHRSMRDVVGPAQILRRDFWVVLKWLLVFACLLMILPGHDQGAELQRQYSISVWMMWVPLGMIGLMLQVTAEEVFFRGYLQTQLIAATGQKSIGMILAALLFGAGHYSGSVDGIAAFLPVLWAACFGLVAGDLTARTGSLGPAIAIHIVNNSLAIFFAPTAGQLSGFGLWLRDINLEDAYTDPLLICFEVISLLIMWLIARIALKR